ncbi:MAG: 3-deoxy-D-manno-octulosonic acid transferase, partial [Methylococcaceae bacterium]|nr:3-deoxy-D-manno-octulosonic acid transferase [Methylococcaceae bacterium]
MRIFYSAIFYLIIPFVLLRLYWRGFKTPHHRQRWNERFALYTQHYPQGVIWFHAVSVGEVEALFPLVKQMQTLHSDTPILITTMTPTGSARVKAVLGESVSHVYVPYDLPDAVYRFMQCFKPKLAVMIETEIWPN